MHFIFFVRLQFLFQFSFANMASRDEQMETDQENENGSEQHSENSRIKLGGQGFYDQDIYGNKSKFAGYDTYIAPNEQVSSCFKNFSRFSSCIFA